MDNNYLLILGLIDCILEILKVPLVERYEVRNHLLATISTNIGLELAKNPEFADKIVTMAPEITEKSSSQQMIQTVFTHFGNIDMAELKDGSLLKQVASNTLIEFVQKSSSNPDELIQTIKASLEN